jgi:D-alanine--poly(phosphoribitol) ligase subunit 1
MNAYLNLGELRQEALRLRQNYLALKYKENSYTHSEIEDLVALIIPTLGKFEKGSCVALLSDKSPIFYALMVACIYLGLPILNLDPDAPKERNQSILRQANPVLIISNELDYEYALLISEKINSLSASSVNQIFNFQNDKKSELPTVIRKIDGEDVAYFMFTSGSTGEPKGVYITHQNIMYFLKWGIEWFKPTQHDVFTGLNPKYFDNSIFDFFVGFFQGFCLLPVDKNLLQKPLFLLQYLRDMGATIWFSVPSLYIYIQSLRAFDAVKLDIRHFIFGGESFPKDEFKKLFIKYKSTAEFTNVYGPTEATCICTARKINDADIFDEVASHLPLGKLLPSFDYTIISSDSNPDKGELVIMGPSVGKGYLGNKAPGSFYQHSDNTRYRKTAYKTGDLVEKRDGEFHYLGRIDNQIKLMGHRVELEEIEVVFAAFKKIKQVICVFDPHKKVLVLAYSSDEPIDIKSLSLHARKNLPTYMQPNSYRFFKKLPQNQNGKVDRKEINKTIK